ncbi:MAG: XRE family transcriptional regulator [Anaerovoracaceae bacterium]
MEKLQPDIGNKLRSIRKELGFSLDVASKMTGVSKAMLGQIERGESVPTISTLWKISRGLKVTFSNFIAIKDEENKVTKVDDIYPLEEENGAMRVYNLFPFDPMIGIDFLHIEIDPKCVHESIAHNNVLNEYIAVIEGELEMKINDEYFTIPSGGVIHFDGKYEHTYANNGNEKVIFHNVIKYR